MTLPPHVLHIVDMNPNKRGPIELQLVEMANQSRDREWRMDVCFPTAAPQWYHTELSERGCGIHTIADLNKTGVIDALGLVTPETVVHLHFGSPLRYGAASKRRGARAVIRTEHTYLPPSSPVRQRIRALRYRSVDVTIACSRYIAEQCVREYRVRPDALRTVLNGVDTELFRPHTGDEKLRLRQKWLNVPPDAFVVVVACHLTARKRVELIINAMPDIIQAIPNTYLIIAGEGEERSALTALVQKLGLGPAVQFLTGDNLVSEIYGAADVAALTSWGEGLPGSGMEALACGIPLVATRSPGLAEVAEHEVSGSLVAPTPTAVGAAITRLGADAKLRTRMSIEARRRAERCFDVRRTAAETFAIYSDCLQQQ